MTNGPFSAMNIEREMLQMIAKIIDIHEAQTRLFELLALVTAGSEVLVTQAQRPVMRLMPVSTDAKQRIPGLHVGMGWISDDFDEPLADEFWAGA